MDDYENIEPDSALTCAAVYLLRAEGECWVCKKQTRMFALMALPPLACHGYDAESADKDGPMLRTLSALPSSLVRAVTPLAGRVLRVDRSNTLDASYWMNHCEHCDAKQGDFFVHGPNGPFWPFDQAGMEAIHATPHRWALPDAWRTHRLLGCDGRMAGLEAWYSATRGHTR